MTRKPLHLAALLLRCDCGADTTLRIYHLYRGQVMQAYMFDVKCFRNNSAAFSRQLISEFVASNHFQHFSGVNLCINVCMSTSSKNLCNQIYRNKRQTFSRMMGFMVLLPAAFEKTFGIPTKWKCRTLVQ